MAATRLHPLLFSHPSHLLSLDSSIYWSWSRFPSSVSFCRLCFLAVGWLHLVRPNGGNGERAWKHPHRHWGRQEGKGWESQGSSLPPSLPVLGVISDVFTGAGWCRLHSHAWQFILAASKVLLHVLTHLSSDNTGLFHRVGSEGVERARLEQQDLLRHMGSRIHSHIHCVLSVNTSYKASPYSMATKIDFTSWREEQK